MVSTGQQGAVEALEMKAKEYGVQLGIRHQGRAAHPRRRGGGRVTGVVASKTSDWRGLCEIRCQKSRGSSNGRLFARQRNAGLLLPER